MRAGRTVGVAGGVSVAGDAGAGEEPWRSRVGMTDARSRSGGAGVLQGARQAPRTGINVQLADSNIGGALLTRAELREEVDRFRDEIVGLLRDQGRLRESQDLDRWDLAGRGAGCGWDGWGDRGGCADWVGRGAGRRFGESGVSAVSFRGSSTRSLKGRLTWRLRDQGMVPLALRPAWGCVLRSLGSRFCLGARGDGEETTHLGM